MLDPIQRSIEVPCSQERAFTMFVSEMETWWPLGRFTTSALGGAPAKAIRVQAEQGGTIVEIGADGSEVLWGTFEVYDPFGYVSMRFHVPHPKEGEVKARSRVEVRFTALAAQRTRVDLTQSDWEAFGEMAKMMVGGYGTAWNLIFEQAYKAACGG